MDSPFENTIPPVFHEVAERGDGYIIIKTVCNGQTFKYTVFTDGDLLPASVFESLAEARACARKG